MDTCIKTRLLLSYLLFASSLFAQQNPQPYFRNYSTEQGLPSPEVHCIMEDSRGYLWVGTDNGVARFDGYTFRTYDTKDGLEKNVILNILEDQKGRVWLSSLSGEVFIWDQDTIRSYPYNDIIQSYQKKFGGGQLNYLSADQTAYLELSTLGVLKIDRYGKDTLITSNSPYTELIFDTEGLPDVIEVEVSRTDDEDWAFWNSYLIDNQRISFEFISDTSHFKQEVPGNFNKRGYSFKAQLLSTGELLFFHHGNLFCFEGEQLLWKKAFDFQASEITEDQDGSIWFCGMGRSTGLRRYAHLQALKNGHYDDFLRGSSIASTYRDAQGGLWVASLEQGLFYAANPEITTYDQRFGLSESFVNAVAFKNEKQVYIGCKNGEICLVDIAKGQIVDRFYNPVGFDTWNLLYDSKKEVLWSSGKYWKNGSWHALEDRSVVTNRERFFWMEVFQKQHFTAPGALLGCNHAGFFILDTENDTVQFDPRSYGLQERTYAVDTRLDGSIWVGNNRGVFQFKNNSLVAPDVDHPAFKNRVEDIDEMPDSSLVFGTKGYGVIHWKGKEVITLSTAEGLTSNMIEDVHVDEAGQLWVSTLNGLNKINFDSDREVKIRSFTVANGLASNEIYKIRSNAGQLWLCTSEGLIKFIEPELDTIARQPLIQAIHINNMPVALAQEPSFRYDQNNLEFDFLTINFRQNGNILYRYRILADADWQYTKNRSVNYSQLAAGTYRFELQSQNESGYWSASTTYRFSIISPWWQRWWAISIWVGIGLVGLVYYFRRRTAALKKEAAIQQQMTKLERSALQAQMNPHFIFNSLNSIQNFILKNDKKKAVEYLARFAKLVRYNLDLAIEGQVTLAKEVQLLDHYLALEQQRFNHQFDYQIEVEAAIDQYAVAFPPLLIQPYVENAIIHGLAPKEGKGALQIAFKLEGTQLLVKIRDNGIGYQEMNGAKKHGFKSVGMSITRKRLELLGTSMEKAVQIEALYDASENVEGTEVNIVIHTKLKSNGAI